MRFLLHYPYCQITNPCQPSQTKYCLISTNKAPGSFLENPLRSGDELWRKGSVHMGNYHLANRVQRKHDHSWSCDIACDIFNPYVSLLLFFRTASPSLAQSRLSVLEHVVRRLPIFFVFNFPHRSHTNAGTLFLISYRSSRQQKAKYP